LPPLPPPPISSPSTKSQPTLRAATSTVLSSGAKRVPGGDARSNSPPLPRHAPRQPRPLREPLSILRHTHTPSLANPVRYKSRPSHTQAPWQAGKDKPANQPATDASACRQAKTHLVGEAPPGGEPARAGPCSSRAGVAQRKRCRARMIRPCSRQRAIRDKAVQQAGGARSEREALRRVALGARGAATSSSRSSRRCDMSRLAPPPCRKRTQREGHTSRGFAGDAAAKPGEVLRRSSSGACSAPASC